jgi:hypothetical protein
MPKHTHVHTLVLLQVIKYAVASVVVEKVSGMISAVCFATDM